MTENPISGDEDLEDQRGLGRGLAEVLELQQQAPPARGLVALVGGQPAAPSALDPVLLHDAAGAILGGLEQSLAPDLCAYVHDAGDRPTLHMRTPALGALTPDAAFWLFSELRGRLHGLAEDPLDAAGFRGITVRVAGDGTAGLFAVARRSQIADAERSAARSYCQTFGQALHDPIIVPEVQAGDAGEHREASLESVARSALHSMGPRVAFRYAGARSEDGHFVALVLAEGPGNKAALAQATARARSSGVEAAARAAAGSL